MPSKHRDEARAIVKRQEWFYGPRRAGAEGRMAAKRQQAVEAVRQAQATRRAESTAAWVPMGPSSSNFGDWRFGKVSGRTPSLAKDWATGALYLGSASGGLWKSMDDGTTWTSLFEAAGTQTVGEVVVDPNRTGTVWVGTGENSMWCEEYFGIGLLRSTDGGATWEPRNGSGSGSLSNLSTFASICIDPRNSDKLVVGGFWWGCSRGSYQEGGIFTTDDAGLSWTKRLTGYVTEIVRDPGNPDLLWAGVSSGLWTGGNGGVFKSTDAGLTWSQQSASGLPTGETGRVEVAVSPSNPSVVYALFETVNAGNPQFWRTTDGGVTWKMMSSDTGDCNGQCWYDMVVRVHSSNPDVVYRGTVRIFKSENGGATWRDLSGSWSSFQKVHQDTHALLVDPQDGGTFYVGCDGGIWKSADGGASFQNLNANLNLTQFYDVGIHPTDDGIIVGGSQDNSSLARTGSDTWDLMEVTGDGFVSFINPSDPQVVYTASYAYPFDDTALPTVFRSTTGPLGDYWFITDYGCGITPGDRIAWVTPYALDPHSPSTLYLGTHRMYRSTDRGDHWTHVGPSDMAGGSDTILSLAVSRTDGKYVYAGTTSGRVWQTADGGGTWSEISGRIPFTREVNDVEADPSDPSRAFLVLSGFGTAHLYAYTGADWEARGSGLPDVPANTVLALTSTDILVGTDVGVFRSTNAGATFTPWSDGMPLGAVVMDLEFNPRTQTITAGTYGRGAWQARVPDCIVSCAAQGPTNTLVNAQAEFSATASTEGCTGSVSYSWNFGDGSPSSTEQNPQHTYASVGKYTWTCTASLGQQTCAQTGEVSVTLTPPPAVASMRKQGSPFRIKVSGAYFQSGVKVQINGSEWTQVTRKNEGTLVLGGGSSLKAAVPKGTPTAFAFTNPDGGRAELSWQW